LDIGDEAMDWLANRGYQPEFGARPLRRVIQREVDRQLSRMLLAGELSPGQTVHIATRDGQLSFDVTGTAEVGDETRLT
jgi:ATP-dependent Clp protease ATP-binding subunit ClpC